MLFSFFILFFFVFCAVLFFARFLKLVLDGGGGGRGRGRGLVSHGGGGDVVAVNVVFEIAGVEILLSNRRLFRFRFRL